MKKNVLIVCDVFPPQYAPRMGYLCKFLKKYNWQAFVLSSEYKNDTCYDKDFSFLANGMEVENICVSDNEQQKYLETNKYTLAKNIRGNRLTYTFTNIYLQKNIRESLNLITVALHT